VSRLFSTVSRRPRRNVPRVAPSGLNDLFTLFPDLPRFQRRPIADQFRQVRENIARMRRDVRGHVARRRAAAARVKASWLARRRG
jgi:hypothetical protein